ncbi:MAG TPA: DNA gyrase inhibitor YacG [Verrucomicrobiae bacterium]|nr:DNA gyrase inhibitor YacG [Verrucomicrobiae bacterium]
MTDLKVTRLRPVRPCPICKRPSAQAFHPFCSARCADIDLNRWLSGSYVIPARDDEEEETVPANNEDDES